MQEKATSFHTTKPVAPVALNNHLLMTPRPGQQFKKIPSFSPRLNLIPGHGISHTDLHKQKDQMRIHHYLIYRNCSGSRTKSYHFYSGKKLIQTEIKISLYTFILKLPHLKRKSMHWFYRFRTIVHGSWFQCSR